MDEKCDIWGTLIAELGGSTDEQIAECVWIMETNSIIIATFSNRIYLFKDYKYQGVTEIELFEKESLLVGRNSKQTPEE